jgi:hypothetical protein
MDAFETFWRWASKSLEDHTVTIPAELHHAVMSLPGEDWHDRHCSFARAWWIETYGKYRGSVRDPA